MDVYYPFFTVSFTAHCEALIALTHSLLLVIYEAEKKSDQIDFGLENA